MGEPLDEVPYETLDWIIEPVFDDPSEDVERGPSAPQRLSAACA
jgi:hypothetical protein